MATTVVATGSPHFKHGAALAWAWTRMGTAHAPRPIAHWLAVVHSFSMNHTDDLFADQGPAFAPAPDRLEIVAGKVVATMNKPSAAQKRFNTLMARIDAEQTQATKMRHAMETHGTQHRKALHELAQRSQQLCKSMLLLLDARIQAPSKPQGLTANQKRQAIRMVLGLCDQLSDVPDDDVQTVYQRYAEVDDEDDAEQARLEAQELLESYLGEDFAQGREFDSPEDVLRAAMEFEQQKHQAQQEKRNAKRAARKAAKGPTAREQAAQQKDLDAQNALRTVFRQLASALHPDREPDEALRKQKTALMSEVNAAYERKDLNALLRIQLQAEMVDSSKAARLSDAKLKAMCNLLAEQLRALEIDTLHLCQALHFEFGYRPSPRFDEAAFLAVLHAERSGLQDDLVHMQKELEQVQDDKMLKAWLKEQTRLSKQPASYAPGFAMDLDDVLSAMMQRR